MTNAPYCRCGRTVYVVTNRILWILVKVAKVGCDDVLYIYGIHHESEIIVLNSEMPPIPLGLGLYKLYLNLDMDSFFPMLTYHLDYKLQRMYISVISVLFASPMQTKVLPWSFSAGHEARG